jgi:hypothetical protein
MTETQQPLERGEKLEVERARMPFQVDDLHLDVVQLFDQDGDWVRHPVEERRKNLIECSLVKGNQETELVQAYIRFKHDEVVLDASKNLRFGPRASQWVDDSLVNGTEKDKIVNLDLQNATMGRLTILWDHATLGRPQSTRAPHDTTAGNVAQC